MQFQNAQWSVTEYGLESRSRVTLPTTVGMTPQYVIEAACLNELRGDGLYSLPVHMAEKNWVEVSLFCEAFAAAFHFHKAKFADLIDPIKFLNTLVEAQKVPRIDGSAF